MADLYLTEAGDLLSAPSGDFAVTQTTWRDDVQQVYVRCMTDVGDFRIYPDLGASLTTLYGQPQSPLTGQLGVDLIRRALEREGRFAGKPFNVHAIPVGPQAIRFDVFLTSGSREQLKISVEQDLGVV
jgi:hypothetical protein